MNMIKIKTNIFMIIIYFILLSPTLLADPLTDLQLIIQEQEIQIKELNSKIDNIDQNIQLNNNELKLWKDKTLFDIKYQNWVVVIGTIIIVIFGGISIFRVKNWIKENAEKIVQNIFINKISSMFEINSGYIKDILKTQECIAKSKSKRICIVSKTSNPGNITFLNDFFYILGFENIIFSTIRELEKIRGVDIIIFNNENSSITEIEIKDIIKHYQLWDNLLFIYFGPDYLPDMKKYQNLIFSNTRRTLYHRLIESIQYENVLHIIKESKKNT